MKTDEWPLFILIVAVGIAFWNLTLPAPLQPYIAADLGVSLGQAAQLVTVSAAAAMASLVVYGLWGFRIHPRVVIWVGLAALTAGSALATHTDRYAALLAVRVLNGVADGLIYPAAWVAIATYLPRERWGFGNQVILAGTALAAIVGLPLANIWASGGAWQSAFKWFSLAGLATLVLTLALQFAPQHASTAIASERGFGRIWGSGYLRGLLLSNIFVACSWFGVVTFIGGLLVSTYRPTTSEFSWFFVAVGLAFAAGSLLIYSKTRKGRRLISVVSGLAVCVMTLTVFAWTANFWLTLILGSIFAFARSPGLVAMETTLLEDTEEVGARVAAITSVDLVSAFGTLIGAALGGFVLSAATYAGIGVILAASAALSLILLLATQEPLGSTPA